MNKLNPVLVTILLIFLAQPVDAASTKDEVLQLQKEVEQLKQGQAAMQDDLSTIRKLLEEGSKPPAKPPAPKPFEPVDISIANAPSMGSKEARVTMVEYTDYQCPFCKRHLTNTMPSIKENYIDTGKVRFVLREFPLTSIHPQAVVASMAALCAKDQGNYWDMHAILFENQRSLDEESIKSYSDSIGLDREQFIACMDSLKYREQVQKDLEQGQSLGIRGTPSFAIGITNSDDPDTVKVVKVIPGAAKYDAFAKEIDSVLNSLDNDSEAP